MKNFKKIVSLVLVCVMMCSFVGVVSADRNFPDLPSGHWAYSYVQRLVSDGTINGYVDGTFLPNRQVTRAEFVKMIGKTSISYDKPFADVPASHWAYDYIMYSNMDVDGTNFIPDVAITRNDVVKLLWKRAGSPTGNVVPSIITNQCDKPDAVAWAYTYGIMEGDDGVSLRLGDGLTRAEAAALICRSRDVDSATQKVDFSTNVNEDLLERVYNSFELFDGEYAADTTFTNGEIAEAAMRIAAEQTVVTYNNISTNTSVDRPNTLSFYVLCTNVWGKSKMTESFYDAKANNLDALAAFMYAFDYKANKYLVNGDKNDFYEDVKSIKQEGANKYITAAYQNGIKLGSHNKLSPNSEITAKSLALILLQMDSIAGLNSNYVVREARSVGVDASLKTEIYSYPNNHASYKFILDGIDGAVYKEAFVDIDGKKVDFNKYAPKDSFRFARDHQRIYTIFLQMVASALAENDIEVKLTYYPSMVVTTDKEYVMRVKVSIIDIADGKLFADVFPAIAGENFKLNKGMEFYADIATGALVDGSYIPVDKLMFTNTIR